ncbi:(2Fe-2S)-binding protein [Pseudonocardia acidicola]|uniref:(2Fe-2S)-binding protein n=1 Tax=Pseudonocardia acidicola TaxID=2724939 RepID=A0ABX1SGM8_9PSEU|nr:(2Fe-2S)-binding protein [Pseudonocardia acidicola]NMH99952.1 (2Fe-2S)-binding protein [Pseudonocardia acidicola]
MTTNPKHVVNLTVNGESHEVLIESRRTLADVLREDVGLTGTKLGCEHGVCGACTVLLDGSAVRSCLIFAVQAQDAEISTVEGLAEDGKLDYVQQAFTDNHGLQCGFCTAGMLMSVHAMLAENPEPTEDEIRAGLNGNLCRCTGYQNIVKSTAAAAAAGKAARSSAQAS